MKYPTQRELVNALKGARSKADEWDCNDGLDVRLQVTGAGWSLHLGDPSYDTDHHGAWGSNCVFPCSDTIELTDVADSLLAQCEDE